MEGNNNDSDHNEVDDEGGNNNAFDHNEVDDEGDINNASDHNEVDEEGENNNVSDHTEVVDGGENNNEYSIDLDWKTFLPSKTTEVPPKHNHGEDFDQLYTPPSSEDEQKYEHFPNFKAVRQSSSS